MSPSSTWRLALVLAAALAVSAPVVGLTDPIGPGDQPAVVLYGSGSGGGGGNLPAVADAFTSGKPGDACTWTLQGAPPQVVTYFLLGFTQVELDLTSAGLSGHTLLSTFDLLLLPMLTGPAGNQQFSLVIPANPSLVGLELYNQWLYADAGNTMLDGSTNGVRVTIQP